MSDGIRGRIMIINITTAAGSTREGSKVDYHNISKLFQEMRFDLVKSEQELSDLTAEVTLYIT